MIPKPSRNAMLLLALILFVAISCSSGSDLTPVNLRTEYKTDPYVDTQKPRLSWELTSETRGQVQTAWQILVASSAELLDAGKHDRWNSDKVPGNATNQVEYAGKPLQSRDACYWKVRSWDKDGNPGPWSATAKWEIGLLDKSDWQAEWIGNDLTALGKGKVYHLPPSPFFRKETILKPDVKSARLYVTSLGLYEFQINGNKIGNDCFTPGWTDYNKRVYYQTYDVTSQLKEGENVFGAILADGWYAGYLGYALLIGNPVVRNFYGDVPLLKAQIEVEYVSGERELIATGPSWKTNCGPILEADILNGETYDANLEFDNWISPGYDDSGWKSSASYPDKAERSVECYPGNPVQGIEEIKAKTLTQKPGGKYIFDLGQNFAGVVRLNVKGSRGDTITIRYGEMLFPNGDLMTENLRKARATDTYILKGNPAGESWTPRFTYHGFQYVEVSGFRKEPGLDAITGIAMSSSTPKSGTFETDNKMVNQLYQNIVWTQRSNYFDIPTDCPQRDERLGWTGDAQAYIKSATFNNDIASFYNKWLVDLNDAQRPDHTYPLYAPAPNVRKTDTYSPGWSEAGIVCPHTIYKTYGDTRMIREFWPNMVAYMKFMEEKSNGEYVYKERSFEDISPKGGYGDWLSVGLKTPPDLLASIYFACCASLMQEMAEAVGKNEDAGYFGSVAEKARKAFAGHYTDGNGRFRTNSAAYGNGDGYIDGALGFEGHTQTAYANAIYMKMLNRENELKAGNHIRDLIQSNGGKLSTGFLGLRPLLPALSATGHSDEAFKLLLSEEYPSWGFEVANGATTIWERWNSYIRDKGFENNAGMNSFNHYAFGSVNEWLFGNVAGIKVDQAGFRTFIIRPEIPGKGINYAKASYHSINGEIISSWKREGEKIRMQVTVPVNTRATVFIPATGQDQVSEGNKPLQNSQAMEIIGFKDGCLHLEVGSGTYHFNSTIL
ncbi:MAG TPA: glycoside hydrolase family 78 protein [Prolixibacteraceae bacterium]|nr:glycoside hydrolase family 78 protein [Prolixibacteraceae bacterium]